jgi:diguanylate cyclase (GGDEF)-like protein/PAS domain S-box-containing protein
MKNMRHLKISANQFKHLDDLSMFENVFLQSDIGMIVIDDKEHVVAWNTWISEHSGKSIDEVRDQRLTEIFPVLRQSSLERGINSALKNGMSSIISHTLNKKPFPFTNRFGFPVSQHIMVRPLDNGSGVYYLKKFCLIQISDVSGAVSRELQRQEQTKKIKALAEKLAEEKERAQVTLSSIADAVIATDGQGIVMSLNPVARQLINITEEDAKGQHVSDVFRLIDEKTRDPVSCLVTRCLQKKKTFSNENEHMLLGSDGRHYAITDSVAPIIDIAGNLIGAVLVIRDVTRSRELTEELNWQTQHDPLTGLANRRAFEERMKKLLGESKQYNHEHHLLYLDLDQFKVVNDTCGHDAGDELLAQIGAILQQHLRQSDLLARLGGDEFGILLECCNETHSFRIANLLRLAIQDFRFCWQNQTFRVGVSIGVAKITGEEVKAAEILSNADSACYVAKDQGRNRVHFHQMDACESSAQQREMQWISKIQAALDENRFKLYAQRIQETNNKQSHSKHYEILMRMVGEKGELIPPGAFLPAAERFNLMPSLDRWVIDNVFMELKCWAEANAGEHDIVIAINLSGTSLADQSLLEHILEQLEDLPLSANSICFEITETAAIGNLSVAMNFITTLRNKGCRFALDDFGSGLSSFAYLKTLPVDYLKIDGHFVKDIVDDPIDRAFVESINQIGHVMGLSTIAEFVENDEILKILSEIGVNHAQGYGIHKPCPIEDIL